MTLKTSCGVYKIIYHWNKAEVVFTNKEVGVKITKDNTLVEFVNCLDTSEATEVLEKLYNDKS